MRPPSTPETSPRLILLQRQLTPEHQVSIKRAVNNAYEDIETDATRMRDFQMALLSHGQARRIYKRLYRGVVPSPLKTFNLRVENFLERASLSRSLTCKIGGVAAKGVRKDAKGTNLVVAKLQPGEEQYDELKREQDELYDQIVPPNQQKKSFLKPDETLGIVLTTSRSQQGAEMLVEAIEHREELVGQTIEFDQIGKVLISPSGR